MSVIGNNNIIVVRNEYYFLLQTTEGGVTTEEKREINMSISIASIKQTLTRFEDGLPLLLSNNEIDFKPDTPNDEKYNVLMLISRNFISPIDVYRDGRSDYRIYKSSLMGETLLSVLSNQKIIGQETERLKTDGFPEDKLDALLFEILAEKAKSYAKANMEFNQQVNIALTSLTLLGKLTGQEKLVGDIFNALANNEKIPQEFKDSLATAVTENATAIGQEVTIEKLESNVTERMEPEEVTPTDTQHTQDIDEKTANV